MSNTDDEYKPDGSGSDGSACPCCSLDDEAPPPSVLGRGAKREPITRVELGFPGTNVACGRYTRRAEPSGRLELPEPPYRGGSRAARTRAGSGRRDSNPLCVSLEGCCSTGRASAARWVRRGGCRAPPGLQIAAGEPGDHLRGGGVEADDVEHAGVGRVGDGE